MLTTQHGSAIDCQIDIDKAPDQPWMRDIERKPLHLPAEIVVDNQLIAVQLANAERHSGKYHLSLKYSLPRIFIRNGIQNVEIKTLYDHKIIYNISFMGGDQAHGTINTFLEDLNASLEPKLYGAKLDSSIFEPKSGLWSEYSLEKKIVANHIFAATEIYDQSPIDLLHVFTISYPKHRGARQLLAEMLLKSDEAKTANDILEKLQSEDLRNIETDRLLIRARNILFGSPGIEEYRKALQSRFCAMPFEYFLAPASKTCWLCPPTYLPVCVGDLDVDDFDSTVNSEWALNIRESIVDGSYRYCLWLLCPHIQRTMRQIMAKKTDNGTGLPNQHMGLPHRDEIKNPCLRTVIAKKRYHLDQVQKIEFGYDWTCNLACPSCRNDFFKNSSEELSKLKSIRLNFVIPALSKTRTLMFGASGEPLASPHYREILGELSKEQYPELELEICTNGLLFQNTWKDFPNLEGMLKRIHVSIDAATKETYKIVRRGGSWSLLMRNLELLHELRGNDVIERFEINFTVQMANFKELVQFVQLGKRLNCDKVVLRRIVNFGNVSAETHQARDVCNPMHPEHDELMESLKDPVINDPIVFMTNVVTL